MVSLVNSHTNATSSRWHLWEIRWHLWEVDLRFALNSTPGWHAQRIYRGTSGQSVSGSLGPTAFSRGRRERNMAGGGCVLPARRSRYVLSWRAQRIYRGSSGLVDLDQSVSGSWRPTAFSSKRSWRGHGRGEVQVMARMQPHSRRHKPRGATQERASLRLNESLM